MRCAELALQHDPKNLNALLLKQQVLNKRLREAMKAEGITSMAVAEKSAAISPFVDALEAHLATLHRLGYRPMPVDMQRIILQGLQSPEDVAYYKKDKNPSPFTTITPLEEDDAKYLSLSGGLFQEVFDPTEKVTFGHFTFDPVQQRITSYKAENHQYELIDPVAFAYNFGARMYDARLGRFLSGDPSAAKYSAMTPYNAMFNNPINVIDPDGRDGIYIVFPDYEADGYPMTGHAGILLIDNKTGLTKYYEYGRYDEAQIGIVNHYAVPDLVLDEDGRPTAESLNKTLAYISEKSGHGQKIEGAYFQSDKFQEMNNYAQKLYKQSNTEFKEYDPNRTPYSITGNNCGTFACDVANQDEDLNTPWIIDPRPVSIGDEYRENFTPIDYNPGEGTEVEYDERTVKFDSKTGETSSSQSLMQTWLYGSDEE